ncbi:MAG: iron ABC transporter permease [Candidatus Bathyarchaeota archaeon]|nr:iron ABC transporter permease [Candidatus Bathyarchaeota archaeon]
MSQKQNGDKSVWANPKVRTALLFLSPVIIFLISLCVGRYIIPIPTVFKILSSPFFAIEADWPSIMETVIFNVRLPRLVMVSFVGASLAISGASFQGILKNPLVSSDILGVAYGAGFGAALAILLFPDPTMIQFFAFGFGMLAVGLAYMINSFYKRSSTLILVLSGIIVGAFFSSLISLAKYTADPETKLPEIVFWLLGSFASIRVEDVIQYVPLMVIGIIVLLLLRWRINVLSLDDMQAKSLGLNIKKYQAVIVFFATLITASAVCVSGIISWVGLIVPHIARMIVGPNNSKVLPASVAIGMTYLLVIDDIARTLVANEIPIGVLTGVIGAPFFGYLLLRQRVGWS